MEKKKAKTKFSIDKIKIPSLNKEVDVSELLNAVQQNKVSLTREAVSDIQAQVQLREQLHVQILEELESVKTQLSNLILSTSNMEEQEKARLRGRRSTLPEAHAYLL